MEALSVDIVSVHNLNFQRHLLILKEEQEETHDFFRETLIFGSTFFYGQLPLYPLATVSITVYYCII